MKAISYFFVILLFVGCGSSDNNSTSANGPIGVLSEDQKYSLAYMWHEEKLAKDLYLELNRLYPSQQLQNIAINSETQHIELVQDLVAMYNINITNLVDYEVSYSAQELNSMPAGLFAVPEIQSLYNRLLEVGSVSKRASLEVGCMVEVVDINDLSSFLQTSQNNPYITNTFTLLMEGSYTHYWAFDSGLKSLEVADGCCSLGDSYCHPEYPSGAGNQGGRNR